MWFVLSPPTPAPPPHPSQQPSFLLPCKMADHIALIIELLGMVPRKLIIAGKYSKDFFTKKGNTVLWIILYDLFQVERKLEKS